jgi:hypothetical protein
MKVLYVAGLGRSGTTLLGTLIGQSPAAAFVGEVMHVWDQWDRTGIVCGAGEPLRNCTMWSTAMSAAGAESDAARRRMLFRIQTAACRTAVMPLWAVGRWRARQLERMDEYLASVASLYEGLFAGSGAQLIVDTSKVPAYATLLEAIPQLDVFVLHMVRDPRAVAYSRTRTKHKLPGADSELMEKHAPLVSALQWDAYNVGVPLLHLSGRYMRMTYEDLVQRPDATLEVVGEFVGAAVGGPGVGESEHVVLRPAHSLSGNPMRFGADRPLRMRLDDEWEEAMPAVERRVVGAVTWPVRKVLHLDRRGSRSGPR